MYASTPKVERRPRTGFTLLEVLVAFTIMAIALVALLQAFATGLRSTYVAEERGRLLAVAESRLASVGATVPLAPGVYTGTDGDTDWEVVVRPYVAGTTNDPAEPGFVPMAVEVTVTAPGGARETLRTLRLARLR